MRIWGGTVQSVDQSERRGHRHGGYSRYHWHCHNHKKTSSLPFFSLYLSGQCLLAYCCYIFCSIIQLQQETSSHNQLLMHVSQLINGYKNHSINGFLSGPEQTYLSFTSNILSFITTSIPYFLFSNQSNHTYFITNIESPLVINSIEFHDHYFKRQ